MAGGIVLKITFHSLLVVFVKVIILLVFYRTQYFKRCRMDDSYWIRALKLFLLTNPSQMSMFKMILVFQAVAHNSVKRTMA